MRLLVERLALLITGETSTPSHGVGEEARRRAQTEGHHAIVYRIRIDEVTGRYERR